MRQRFRKRAGIEPVIDHLKSDHRLGKCFLKRVYRRPDKYSDSSGCLQLKKMHEVFLWPVKMLESWLKVVCMRVTVYLNLASLIFSGSTILVLYL